MRLNQTLKVGDRVIWAGGWGADEPKTVTVKTIGLGGKLVERYVQEVDWADVLAGRDVTVTFRENNHWAYGFQICP